MRCLFSKNKKSCIFAVSLGLLLALGVWSRVMIVDRHFTHIDDIGVAWSILELKKEIIQLDNTCQKSFVKMNTSCRLNWAKAQTETFNTENGDRTLATRFGRFLKNNELIDPVRTAFYFYQSYNIVPMSWTYAPVQFYFTNLLIHPLMNYEQIKFFGRLPSFIFSLFTIVFIAYAAKLFLTPPAQNFDPLAAALIATTSLQSIIYSAQMNHYSAGVFAVTVLVFIFGRIIKDRHISLKLAWLYGAVIALLCGLQYQVLMFLPGFFFTLLCMKKMEVTNKIKVSFHASLSFFIFAIPFVFITLRQHLETGAGMGWNLGPNGEFAILGAYNSVYDLAKSAFERLTNLPLIANAMMMPVPEAKQELGIAKYLICFLMVVGVMTAFFDRHQRPLAVFTMSVMFIWFILLAFGKVSLGPTRHSMVLLPLFIIFTVFGLTFLVKRLRPYISSNMILMPLVTLWILSFIQGYGDFLSERGDKFDESWLAEKIAEHSVDVVIGEFPNSPYFMPKINNAGIVLDQAQYINRLRVNDQNVVNRSKDGVILMWATRSQKSKDALYEMYRKIAENAGLPYLSNLEMLLKKESFSSREVDYSSLTNNGVNSHFVYIYKISDP